MVAGKGDKAIESFSERELQRRVLSGRFFCTYGVDICLGSGKRFIPLDDSVANEWMICI